MFESSLTNQQSQSQSMSVRALKFIKPKPELISLKSSVLSDGCAGTLGWRVHRVSRHIDTHGQHLGVDICVPPTLHIIECLPVRASQVFSSFRMALHNNGFISMIAFCKPGVVTRVLNQMRATDNKALCELMFLPSVGHDERARISFYGSHLEAIQSFMGHIHALCPFNAEVMNACRLVLDGLSTQTFQINHIPEVKALVDDLKGYPNFLPDTVDFDNSLLYDAKEIVNFPDRIPELHLLVLKGNINDVKAYIARHSNALYQRDPFGYLAIELALSVNIDIANLLFFHWYDNVDVKPKPLWKQYMRSAHKIMRAQQNMPMGLRPEDSASAVKKYFALLMPDMPDALHVYEMALNKQHHEYQQWHQRQENQKNEVLLRYPDLDSVLTAISERMPKRQALHQAVLSHKPVSVERFVIDLKQFHDFYQSMLKIHKDACMMSMRYIKHIPECNKLKIFKRFPGVEETLARELTFIAAKVAVHPVCIKRMKDELQEVFAKWKSQGHSDDEINHFNEYAEAIFKYKEQAIRRIECEQHRYRQHCAHVSDVDFNLYTAVLALLAGKEVFSALIPLESGEEVSIRSMLLLVFEHFTKNLEPVQKRYHDYFRHVSHHADEKLKCYARQHLTEAEYPDPFGYTPLLLAVVANNTDYVKAIFDAGCYLDRVDNYVDFGSYYILLEHANTPEMLELLLYYFQNPNQPTTLMNRLRCEGQEVLLRYGYKLQQDSSRLSEIDKIIKGISRYEKPADMLSVILKFVDEELVDGSYDSYVAPDVQAVMVAHNKRIRKYQENMASCPKISKVEFKNNQIITSFSALFQSHLMRVCDLDGETENQLAEIFAKNFKMREEDDDLAARIKFFKSYLENHPQFLIDIYYDASKKIVGFATFAIYHNVKSADDQKPYDFVYISIAAYLLAVDNGLPLSGFRTMLAMYQLSQEENKPLYFYTRVGRPGISIKLLAEGPWSVKYAVNKRHVRYLTEQVVGDRIEPDGVSSIPPVLSLATKRAGSDWRIEQYEHWLNKNASISPDASLTVVSKVTADMIKEWENKMRHKNGLNKKLQHDYNKCFREFRKPSPSLVSKL